MNRIHPAEFAIIALIIIVMAIASFAFNASLAHESRVTAAQHRVWECETDSQCEAAWADLEAVKAS